MLGININLVHNTVEVDDSIEDIIREHIVPNVFKGGIFCEESIKFLNYQISSLLDNKKQIVRDYIENRNLDNVKYFISVLNKGYDFNFVVHLIIEGKESLIYYR